MIPRLGVNIDHVATLRQQRDEGYPSVVSAAEATLNAGANQITIHLREDRRHIQDTDVQSVYLVTQKHGVALNLEMGCSMEIAEIAITTNPEWICLVPEKREEKTTEGGLDLSGDNYKKIEEMIKHLKKNIPNVKISLFVESNVEVMEKCILLNADAVEIHTGGYAKAFLKGEDISVYLKSFEQSHKVISNSSLTFHAGHGLTLDSVTPLLKQSLFIEYNIGHFIISQSVFDGLSNVTRKFLNLFEEYPVAK